MRRAAGELDHLEPARDFARRIAHQFAVLGRDDPRELTAALFDQLLEPEQHARALQRGRRRPRGKGGPRGPRGGIDLGLVREGDARGDDAERRIEHIAGTAGDAGDHLTADPV
jgi:hypothetical protein